MGRKTKQGIDYYPMESDHTLNKKLRLLVRDCGGDAYWVWSCICDVAYNKFGYYFDPNEEDEFDLFATEHCMKTTEYVRLVIEFALKRKLFSREIFEDTGLLTSDRIQINYLYGTYERRRKGATLFLQRRLLDLSPEKMNISVEKSGNSSETFFLNVQVVDGKNVFPLKNVFFPGKNENSTRNNSQSRVEKNREEKSIYLEVGKYAEENDFSTEKKIPEKIEVKIARLGEIEIEVMETPEDWQFSEIKRFLTGSEIQFEQIASAVPKMNEYKNFEKVLQFFVKENIQLQNNYQKSFELSRYFGRWAKPYNIESILNPKNNSNGRGQTNRTSNSEIGRTFTPD